MAFDVGKFEQAQWQERTAEVPASEVKQFFGKKEKPVFIVRNLTGEELFKVEQAVERAGNYAELIKQINSKSPKQAIQAAMKLVGLGDNQPPQFVRSLWAVSLGLVKPDLTHQQVVKLADVSPGLFSRLKIAIDKLNGEGKQVAGEPSASIKKKKSKRR